MARLDNWQSNLSQLIKENRDKPFDFISHNCLIWAGLGIEAVTGNNLVNSRIVGKYNSEKSALNYLRKIEKVNGCQGFLEKYLVEAQPVAFARIGDIVLANPENLDNVSSGKMFGRIPGICYGQISFFVGEDGLVTLETLTLDLAIWVS